MAECIDGKSDIRSNFDKKIQCLDVAKKVADGRCALSTYVWRFGEEYIDDIFMPIIEEHRDELYDVINKQIRRIESAKTSKELMKVKRNISLAKEVIDDMETTDEERRKLRRIINNLNDDISELGSKLYRLSVEETE